MGKWVPGIMVVVALGMGATGCADTGPLEVTYEITGGGDTVTLTRTYPERSESDDRTVTRSVEESDVAVPYTKKLVVDRGKTTLTAEPGTGPRSCRILVEGREVARVAGQADEPVTCRAEIDE
ncbi:hypothetical protein [Cryptosporangium minutisporangium]|uniref:Lipoprotein n=1 Tax=Cryptosporangium minutisporangium TaxID=113569 RepID=A0ABP6SSN5_9ACTN